MAGNNNTPLIKEIAEKQLEQGLIISNLMNEVSDLKKSISAQADGMQRLLFLIDDDHKTGTPGIASQLRNDKQRIESLEKFKNELKITVALIGGVAGALANILPEILKQIFTK